MPAPVTSASSNGSMTGCSVDVSKCLGPSSFPFLYPLTSSSGRVHLTRREIFDGVS